MFSFSVSKRNGTKLKTIKSRYGLHFAKHVINSLVCDISPTFAGHNFENCNYSSAGILYLKFTHSHILSHSFYSLRLDDLKSRTVLLFQIFFSTWVFRLRLRCCWCCFSFRFLRLAWQFTTKLQAMLVFPRNSALLYGRVRLHGYDTSHSNEKV